MPNIHNEMFTRKTLLLPPPSLNLQLLYLILSILFVKFYQPLNKNS